MEVVPMPLIIKPQPKQEQFLSSPADIVIYGGAAGGGKTFGLLMEQLRNINNPKFNSVIFRRNSTQIFTNGGLWDSAMNLFPLFGGIPKKTPKPQFVFPSGAKVVFAHLERYADCLSYQGGQIALICFDELTHFDEDVFWYMFSRNRSDSGISGYIRATTNPDPDSFVRKLVDWWIDDKTGYAIESRSGVIRWLLRVNGDLIWGDSKEELLEYQAAFKVKEYREYKNKSTFPKHGKEGVIYIDKKMGYYYVADESKEAGYRELTTPKSLTFILSMLADNQILMENDPSYLANLKSLPMVEQERLLGGNWNIRPSAGMYFPRGKANLVNELPNDVVRWVRAWDLAATEDKKNTRPEDGAAYTAGVLIGQRKNGRFIIADVVNRRMNASDVRQTIKNTAALDKATYRKVKIRLPQDPGAAGKAVAEQYIKDLAGYAVSVQLESGSKETRAEPLSAQWIGLKGNESGNVDVLLTDWTESYLNQMDNFPDGKFKDMVDASANGFNELMTGKRYSMIGESEDLSENGSAWSKF